MTLTRNLWAHAALAATMTVGLVGSAGCCGGPKVRDRPTSGEAMLQPVQHAAEVSPAAAQVPPPPPRDVPKPPEREVPRPPPGRDVPPTPPERDVPKRAPSDLPIDPNEATKRQLDKAAAAAADRPLVPAAGQVKHVVVLWLKKPGDKEGRKALIDARETIRTIPGVLDVSAGECVPSDRKGVVDSTYDVAVVITFKDEEALRAYGPHPTHQKLLKEVLSLHVERYVVYDFVAR